MRRSFAVRRQYRPYYNLPSKSEHGRKMTGFLTPYRHWMWKQNELWRNVHEAQFEYLRKVYKRQWLESFRVNADEYLCKYNITKAAQLAQWEFEMQAQERKRIENQQLAHGRQALKKKHLDLLREFHERQFFYWYERASERLQYMECINYVPQTRFSEHLERELDKYVAGSPKAYPLNFAGQLPMLEDGAGHIAQVPAPLLSRHATEQPASGATPYAAPERPPSPAAAGWWAGAASAQAAALHLRPDAPPSDASPPDAPPPDASPSDASHALAAALEDFDRAREAAEAGRGDAQRVEPTAEERAIHRRAYIDRGKTGSQSILRRPRLGEAATPPPPPAGSTPMKRRSKKDAMHSAQAKQDALAAQLQKMSLRPGVELADEPKRGEVGGFRGRLRDRVRVPTLEELSKDSILQKSSTLGRSVRTQEFLDKRYGRGKYKTSNTNSGEDL